MRHDDDLWSKDRSRIHRIHHLRGGDRLPEWLHTLALVVAALAAALFYPLSADARAPLAPGSVAPDFALKDLAGRNQRLSEFRGDLVVLTFWAGWCGECRTQLQLLDRALRPPEDGAPGTILLGVALDDDTLRVQSFASSLQLGFPTLLDARQQVARLYEVDRLPLTLLLDRDGVVRGIYDHAANADALLDRIEELSDQ